MMEQSKRYRVGVSGCWVLGKYPTAEDFAAYRSAGIACMEISLQSVDCPMFPYVETAKLAEEYGIALTSFHLPFQLEQEDISKADTADVAVRTYTDIIKRATQVGISTFVIHPSREPIADHERLARMECAKRSLFRLGQVADAYGAVLAVEDLPRTCLGKNSDEMLELLTAHPSLRVCFDTNHLLNEDPVSFVRRLAGKIVTTHISDYDLIDERHWLPGEGKLDWNALLRALDEIGYNGVWMYEINQVCPNTIRRPRNLTCEDFARNARELFSGQVPTVISAPLPPND